jgi:hypothetical protein
MLGFFAKVVVTVVFAYATFLAMAKLNIAGNVVHTFSNGYPLQLGILSAFLVGCFCVWKCNIKFG